MILIFSTLVDLTDITSISTYWRIDFHDLVRGQTYGMPGTAYKQISGGLYSDEHFDIAISSIDGVIHEIMIQDKPIGKPFISDLIVNDSVT